ncbi:hypothetical protein RF11_15819 [Thelohanellus kitauei]|uniref:Uncharacterized protein n=1 Tax=Thelohanellus kitauei TaxID=669202 RepID=A0A0C2NLX7_THEKT|nr:hypothetical protein RF11_15819 [Thelohanellus kitauei]
MPDILFDCVNQALKRDKDDISDENFIEHENLYGRVHMSDFDSLDLSQVPVCSSKPIDKNLHNWENLAQEELIEHESEYKLARFLESAQNYIKQQGHADVIPSGLTDFQKFDVIFYRLFKLIEVPIIEVLYLTAREMGVPIPKNVYEILKICRLSYHGSITLFADIESNTVFHPYFYDNVLQQALNVVCSSEEDLTTFENIKLVFMSARRNEIQLSGRIINKILLALSIYKQFDLLCMILEYAVNHDITATVLTSSYAYFKDTPDVYRTIFDFLVSHCHVTFIDENFIELINKLVVACARSQSNECLLNILLFMQNQSVTFTVEALDALFDSTAPSVIENLTPCIIPLIDLGVYEPFGNGSFSRELWAHFEVFVTSDRLRESLTLLPYLVRTDTSLPDSQFLINYYRLICESGFDENILSRVRGFIQHFDCF